MLYIFSFQDKLIRIIFLSWNFEVLIVFLHAEVKPEFFYEEILQLPTLVPMSTICTGELLQESWNKLIIMPSPGRYMASIVYVEISFLLDYINLNLLPPSSKIWLYKEYSWTSSQKCNVYSLEELKTCVCVCVQVSPLEILILFLG